MVATDPHCEEVVEMCVKGGTRNSGPYVLPTSHPCNHQSEVVRVRSLCGAYYSQPRVKRLRLAQVSLGKAPTRLTWF